MPPFRPNLLFYIGFCFALSYALLLPPFQSPDEPNHFFRAWQLSDGVLIGEKQTDRLGGTLPLGLAAMANSFSILRHDENTKMTVDRWRLAWNTPISYEKREFVDFANTAIYAPFGYIPQALGIGFCRLLGFSPLLGLYVSRLLNVFVFFVFLAQILRLLPEFREILLYITLLPATLVITASANPDVLSMALCWLLLARFLSPLDLGKSTQNILMAVCLSAQKIITVPFMLLGWQKEKRIESVLLFLLSVGGGLAWAWLAASLFIPYDQYNPMWRDSQTLNVGVHPGLQIQYIFSHPLQVLQTLSISALKALPSTAAHLVGKFGWEKNYIAGWMMALLWMGMVGLLGVQEQHFSRQMRILMGWVVLLYVSGFALSNYALWSAVGSPFFDNWQGRYFIPILPLVAFALAHDIWTRWRSKIIQGAVMLLLLGNVAMVSAIWMRYYC